MRIRAFEVRPDEEGYFQQLAKQRGVEITRTPVGLTLSNAEECCGYEAVSILGMYQYEQELLEALRQRGVRYLSTRTIGYNHIDLAAAERVGIRVCHAAYAPSSVADFTVMLMLLAIRKYKPAIYRQNVNDYSLDGLIGKTMDSMTVGVVGTGRIGTSVIQHLHGFGCRILANDSAPNEIARRYAEYVDREQLYREADMITFHLPLTEETYHLVQEETLQRMKDGVILINTARGELMEIQTLIRGIESRKVGALAMDVIENENNIYHESHINDIISNRDMAYIRQFPNVILTQHMAFYTESSVREMVTCGVDGILQMAGGEPCSLELTGRKH